MIASTKSKLNSNMKINIPPKLIYSIIIDYLDFVYDRKKINYERIVIYENYKILIPFEIVDDFICCETEWIAAYFEEKLIEIEIENFNPEILQQLFNKFLLEFEQKNQESDDRLNIINDYKSHM